MAYILYLLLSYFFIGLRGIYRNHLYRKYLEIVENDREFILLDSHNRIKAMSNDILSSFKEVNKKSVWEEFFFFSLMKFIVLMLLIAFKLVIMIYIKPSLI